MTDLTPREILEAIRRGLDETSRRLSYSYGKADGIERQPRPAKDAVADQGAQEQRKG